MFGKIYEYFLFNFALGEGQRGGEFFTPTSLVKLIVTIIERITGHPRFGMRIPRHVRTARPVRRYHKGRDVAQREISLSLYGQEKTLDTIRKMNLAVHALEGDVGQANSYDEECTRCSASLIS